MQLNQEVIVVLSLAGIASNGRNIYFVYVFSSIHEKQKK
jgi:hypothetical protein